MGWMSLDQHMRMENITEVLIKVAFGLVRQVWRYDAQTNMHTMVTGVQRI